MSVMAAYITPHPPLIIPEVGRGKEMAINKTIKSFQAIAEEISSLNPETVIVITPHSVLYQDYIHISPGQSARGNFKQFGDYKTKISAIYDQEFVDKLEELVGQNGIQAGTLGERSSALDHGTMIPLYFIDQFMKDYKVVRVAISGLSQLEHYRFGKSIQRVSEDLNRRTVIVASGDLSHRLKEDGPYNYAPEGQQFDQQVTKAMEQGDFLKFMTFEEGFCEAAGECGLRSFIIMAGALDGKQIESNLLSYEGTYGVGYAVASFKIIGDDPDRRLDIKYEQETREKLAKIRAKEDEYVSLARQSLEYYIRNRKNLKRPDDLLKELVEQRAGVFVSLKKNGRLRGCIGTIMPAENCVADEIIRNAVSAGIGDPRFDPVREDELDDLVYSVDVLGDPEPIENMGQLDVLRYGVIVSKGRKRGLLLPNLEGVTTPQQQVEIALQKAGISPNEDYRMERFQVVRHK